MSEEGYRMEWPEDGKVTEEWIRKMETALEWSSWNLPPHDLPSVLPVIELLDPLVLLASKILHKEPNCVPLLPDPPSSSEVVVVGDLHRQLHDLLHLMTLAGSPSPSRFYVFNGDYVDRGAWGLECFLLLLSWKVFLPDRVILLRGNHESKYCTSVYGFEKEVMAKYGDRVSLSPHCLSDPRERRIGRLAPPFLLFPIPCHLAPLTSSPRLEDPSLILPGKVST